MSIKVLSRDFAFYGLLDFVRRSLSIILVPIYTRVLTQNSYGNLDLIFTVSSALAVLVDLQFVAGFSRLYLGHRRNGGGRPFAGTVIITRSVVGSSIAALFLALGFSGLLELKFFPSFLGHSLAWTIVAAGIPVAFVFDILLVQCQLLRAQRWFLAGALGNTVISTALCIVFTVIVKWGIVGIVLGQVLGTAAGAIILVVGLRREISFSYHGALLKEIARYSLPLVPGWWVGFSSAYVSRFFIFGARGAEDNAILAITTKIAGALGLFYIAYRTAWQPLAMSYIGDEKGEDFYVRSLRVFVAGGIFSVYFLTVLCRPLLVILAPASYSVAENYLPYFLVAAIIGELDVNFQLGNQISMKTYWMSVASTLALGVNVAILIALTPRIGIYAAGIGLLLSFVVKIAITYCSAQRNHWIPYDRRSLTMFGVGCIALLVLSLGRNLRVVDDTVFLSSAVLLGVLVPWLTLAASDRLFIRRLASSTMGRLSGNLVGNGR